MMMDQYPRGFRRSVTGSTSYLVTDADGDVDMVDCCAQIHHCQPPPPSLPATSSTMHGHPMQQLLQTTSPAWTQANNHHKYRRRSPCYGRHHHSLPTFHMLMKQRNATMKHSEPYHQSYLPSQSQLDNPRSSSSSPAKPPFSPTMTMADAIELKRYDILHHKLSTCPDNKDLRVQRSGRDPNEELFFRQASVYMTGLEYAIYKNDYRLAILYYMHAADPGYNCFDGRIIREEHEHMEAAVPAPATVRDDDDDRARDREDNNNDDDDGENHHLEQDHHRRFLRHLSKTHDEHAPMAGFGGLYKLLYSVHRCMKLDKDDCEETVYNRAEFNKTLSSLWLMEQCHSERKIVYEHNKEVIQCTRKALIEIGTEDIWKREFSERVYFLIHTMRRGGRGDNERYNNRCYHQYTYCDGYQYLPALSPQEGLASEIESTTWTRSKPVIPNEICLYVLEFLVDDMLAHTIWRALKHVSDSAATMN